MWWSRPVFLLLVQPWERFVGLVRHFVCPQEQHWGVLRLWLSAAMFLDCGK